MFEIGIFAGMLAAVVLVATVWTSKRSAKKKGRIFLLLALLALGAFHVIVPQHYNAITDAAATVGGFGVVAALVLQAVAEVTR